MKKMCSYLFNTLVVGMECQCHQPISSSSLKHLAYSIVITHITLNHIHHLTPSMHFVKPIVCMTFGVGVTRLQMRS